MKDIKRGTAGKLTRVIIVNGRITISVCVGTSTQLLVQVHTVARDPSEPPGEEQAAVVTPVGV